jgi:hypothetical protein
LMVARLDFWFLKNRKAKKTLLGGVSYQPP